MSYQYLTFRLQVPKFFSGTIENNPNYQNVLTLTQAWEVSWDNQIELFYGDGQVKFTIWNLQIYKMVK